GDASGDAVAREISSRQRGWVCAPSEPAIAAELLRLQRLHTDGRLHAGLRLDRDGVAEFGWSQLARRLDTVLREAATRPRAYARGARSVAGVASDLPRSRDRLPKSATPHRLRKPKRPPRALPPRTLSLWMSSTCASSCAIRLVRSLSSHLRSIASSNRSTSWLPLRPPLHSTGSTRPGSAASRRRNVAQSARCTLTPRPRVR